MNTNAQRATSVIAEQLCVLESDVTPEKSLAQDLHSDSFDLVEMTMNLEDEFGIDIADDDAEKWKTVGDVLTYIEGVMQ